MILVIAHALARDLQKTQPGAKPIQPWVPFAFAAFICFGLTLRGPDDRPRRRLRLKMAARPADPSNHVLTSMNARVRTPRWPACLGRLDAYSFFVVPGHDWDADFAVSARPAPS